MCLRVPKSEPIVFVDHQTHRRPRRVSISHSHHRSARPVSRVSETVISQHRYPPSHRSARSVIDTPPPSPHVIPAPAPPPPPPEPIHVVPAPVPQPIHTHPEPSPVPSPRPLTPPRAPTPPDSRIELVKVEEEYIPAASVSGTHISRRKSKRGSSTHKRDSAESYDREREEVYIQRDRIIERGVPTPPPQNPREPQGGYRIVASGRGRGRGRAREEYVPPAEERERDRRISISYTNTQQQDSPRTSGRFERERERERIVMNEGPASRRKFYRRG